MKGFVITILSVGLIALLVLLAISFHTSQVSTERALAEPLPLIYGSFLLDNVAYEFNTLVGPSLEMQQNNDSTRITVTDIIQTHNYTAEINSYSNFLASEVAGRTASNITTDFTNISGGAVRLFLISDYVYENNHTGTQAKFTRQGGTGANAYYVNFTISAIRAGVTHMQFNDSGTMNVTIYYTDLNGTGLEQGTVFPDQVNTFRVDYVEGSNVVMDIGQNDGNSGSLKIKTNGIRAETSWMVVLPALSSAERLGYWYDAGISYAQGPVSISRRVGK